MAEGREKMREAMNAKRPETVKVCVAAIKDDPKAEKAVECVAQAKGIADLQNCSGADFLKSALKQ